MGDTGGESQSIHPDFARWYRSVSADDDSSRRSLRWAGIQNVLKDLDAAAIEALLRLAYGGRAIPAANNVQKIRQAFKAADDAFEMSGNDREMQVLAGATLAVLMVDKKREAWNAVAALGATTASFGGARKPELPMDLGELGELAICRIGEDGRKRPAVALGNIELPKVDFATAKAKIASQPDATGFGEAFALAAADVSKAMQALSNKYGSAIKELGRIIRVQDEELEVLWWLTGQRSIDHEVPFADVSAESQPFVFAKELASATEFLPGPPAIEALLSRAGLKERRKITIAAGVNSLKPQWLLEIIGSHDPSPLTMPLHAAIKRQLETGPGAAWIPGWAATVEVDSAYSLSALRLGELFYRERLLMTVR